LLEWRVELQQQALMSLIKGMIRDALLVTGCILLIALPLRWIFWQELQKTKRSTPPADPGPQLLTWRDSETLIVGNKGAIHLFNVNTNSLGERIVDRYVKIKWRQDDCFQPAGGRFYLREPESTTVTSGEASPREKGPLRRVIRDWSQPHVFTDSADDDSQSGTNPLDCQPMDYRLRAERKAALEQRLRSVQSSQALLSSSDGDAMVSFLEINGSVRDRRLDLFRGDSRKPFRALPLPAAEGSDPDYRSEVRSFRDSDGSYILYETHANFDANDTPWPLTAWRLSPDLSTVRPFLLPAGPWIVPHGPGKQLSCFSCGCSCYSHFDLMGTHGRLYAHIHGKAVSERSAGLYTLIVPAGKPAWRQVIKGRLPGPIALSPDGCRVAYMDAEQKLRISSTKACAP
jgi:hypothetical protein